MRLSAHQLSTHMDLPREVASFLAVNKRMPTFDVYLDGEAVAYVEEFDSVAGWLTRAKHNEFGHIYVEPGTDDIARETLHGKVTFEMR